MSRLSQELKAKRLANHAKMVDRYMREGRTVSGGATPAGQTDPTLLNLQQRQAVLAYAVEMKQQIYSNTIATLSSGTAQVNIAPRNVGLIKKFIVELAGTYTSVGAAASTALGLANLLSSVIFTDLNNNQRVNTAGWHLAIIKQAKHRSSEPASAPISTKIDDSMLGGQFVASGTAPNFPVVIYPLPSTAGASFRAVFDVPLAYSDEDLRGSVYGNVVNATMNLQLNLNANFSPASADNTLSVWGTATGTVTNLTVTVYQVYLDQLPVGQNGVILPFLDLSTVYELKSTTLTGMVASSDFPVPYANFRDFLSTTAIFNSTGATAGLKNGSDVSYWALQSANFTNIFKIDPLLAAQQVRGILGSDLPLGCYYFSHRKKPISTLQYGNMQLILNPLSVSGTPYILIGWEDFALMNTLTQAGSLAAS
jgi:hypothetical protein